MNLKKFISGVSALTIAASAFAGMAVTASAALDPGDYNETISPAGVERATNNNDGTFTTASNAGNKYALAIADLSGLEDIDKASSVTVEFDTAVANGSRLLVGLGDKAVRGTTAGTSSKSTYDTNGLVMRFGTTDGSYYRVNGGTNNSAAMGATVHAVVTLDRANSKYSYTLTSGDTTLFSATDVDTTVSNITVVEAYTWLSSATFTFSDVSVSYTIPSVPAHNYTVNAVDENEAVITALASGSTGEGYSYTAEFGEFVEAEGVYYQLDSSVEGYSATYTMGTEDAVQTIKYNKNDAIKGYKNAGFAAAANSNGGYAVLATVPAGVYKVTVDLVDRGDRGVYIRNKGVNDTSSNVFTNFGIDKNSAAGEYTAEITVEEETTIAVTGYSTAESTTKTNQSANFNYVVIEYVSELTPAEPVVVTPTLEGAAAYTDGNGTEAIVGKVNVNITGGTYVFDRNNVTYKGNAPTAVTDLNDNALTDDQVNTAITANDIIIYVVINGTTDTNEFKNIQFN